MITTLDYKGVTTESVQEFSLLCQLPSKWGKVNEAWFSKNRLRRDTMSSFASIMLTMVPILHLWQASSHPRSGGGAITSAA